jgi:hypothetical protein
MTTKMEETTATLRTFSNDKYDAMEANILYLDKDKHTIKKRKITNHDRTTYLLTTVVLLSLVIIAFTCNLFKSDSRSTQHQRALYQNYKIDEIPEYYLNSHETTSIIEGFHSYNHINIEDLYNDTIKAKNYINSNDDNKYKHKYYKLIEVCVPHLRRGLKNN